MNFFEKWWIKLTCIHSWEHDPDPSRICVKIKPWICIKCGKIEETWSGDFPS